MEPGVTLFPFLSVLLSTMGVLAFLSISFFRKVATVGSVPSVSHKRDERSIFEVSSELVASSISDTCSGGIVLFPNKRRRRCRLIFVQLFVALGYFLFH